MCSGCSEVMSDAGREKYKFLLYQPRTFRQWLVGSREQERMQLKNLTDANEEAAKTFLSNNYDTGGRNFTYELVYDCATKCMMEVLLLWMRATESSDKEFPFQMHGLRTPTIQNILSISNPELETENYQLYNWVCTKLSQIKTKYCSSYYFKPIDKLRQDIESVVPNITRDLSDFLKGKINKKIGNMEYKHMLDDKSNICNVLCQIAEALLGYDNSTDRSIDAMSIFKILFTRIVQAQENNMIFFDTTNPREGGARNYTEWDETNKRFNFFRQVVNFYIVTELSHQADIESTEDPGRKEKVQDAHTQLLDSILAFVPTKERDAFARQLEDHWLITPAETPWFSGRGARRYLNLLSLFVADKPIGGSIGLGIHSISVMVQSLSTLYFALAMLGAIQLSRTPQRLLPTQNFYLTDIPNADVLPFALGILELAANGYNLFFRKHSHILEFNSAEHLIITSRHISRILFMHQLSPFDLLLVGFLHVRFIEQRIYRWLFVPSLQYMLPQQLTNKQLEKYVCLARYSLSVLWTLSSLHEQYKTRIQESNEIQNQSILPIPVLGAMLQPAVQFTCEMVFTKMPVHKLGLGLVINVLIAVESGEFKVFTSYNDFDRMGRNLIRRLPLRFNQLRNYALGEPEKSHIEQSLRIITNFIIHYFDPRQNIAMDILADAVNTIVTIPVNILHATFGNDCRVVDFRVQGIPTDNYKQFIQAK